MKFITLGHDCQITQELKRRGHSLLSNFTEDIGLKHIRGVVELLESDCQKFYSFERLEILGEMTDGRKTMAVQDVETGIGTVHFLSAVSLEQSFNEFIVGKEIEKSNFMRIMREENNLQLTRTNRNIETIDEIVRLRDTISKLRDGKNFDLYVFQDSKFMRKNWGLPNLHTFCIQQWRWEDRWVGEPDIWNKFFTLFESNFYSKYLL